MTTEEKALEEGPVVKHVKAALRVLAGYPGRSDLTRAHHEVLRYIDVAAGFARDVPTSAMQAASAALESVGKEWSGYTPQEVKDRYRYKDTANKLRGILEVIEAALGS